MTPNQPLVSIIIPCWNAECYVGEAIESALAQTYPNVEVIVIDDGSTDGSLEVIKSFGDRIRWETGPNQGACAARNRGIALARGELIQFLDADDLLLSNKIKIHTQVLQNTKSDIVTCDRYELDYNCDSSIIKHIKFKLYNDPLIFFMRNDALQTSAPLYRRRLLELVGGFDNELPCAQEYDLHLRVACYIIKLYHVNESLFIVRKRENSLSSNYAKILKQYKKIYNKIIHILQSKNSFSDERKSVVAEMLFKAAQRLQRMSESSLSKEYFSWAYTIDQNHGYGSCKLWRQWFFIIFGGYYGNFITDKIVLLKRSVNS